MRLVELLQEILRVMKRKGNDDIPVKLDIDGEINLVEVTHVEKGREDCFVIHAKRKVE